MAVTRIRWTCTNGTKQKVRIKAGITRKKKAPKRRYLKFMGRLVQFGILK